MKRLIMAAALTAAFTYAQENCGIEPIKPIPPIGCKDLEAECVCDKDPKTGALKCRYRWKCIKD